MIALRLFLEGYKTANENLFLQFQNYRTLIEKYRSIFMAINIK
jgi:hypothetical protein